MGEATDRRDRALGCWMGMAVGEAMGLAAKGLKPETVTQFFGSMDSYKDVTSRIGKGIRHYKMPGLYGSVTQRALAVAEAVFQDRGRPRAETAEKHLRALAESGPEHYFGVYRNADGAFRSVLTAPPDTAELSPTRAKMAASGNAACLAVPLALLEDGSESELAARCVDTAWLLSRHPAEVAGTAAMGFLVREFMALPAPEAIDAARAGRILSQAAEICAGAEAVAGRRLPQGWGRVEPREAASMSRTFAAMAERASTPGSLAEWESWICANAGECIGKPVSHAAQGHVQTLLPLAFCRVWLGGDFASTLTGTLNLGREADKLGGAAGALAGARWGFASIPRGWVSGLVNTGELRLRGEALADGGRPPKNAKPLLEMEAGLTRKESELLKKYGVAEPKKRGEKKSAVLDFAKDGESLPDIAALRKEDPRGWREYQKEKSRKKRDRRRGMD